MAVLADLGVVAVGKASGEGRHTGVLARCQHLGRGSSGPPVGDVVGDAAGVQPWVLRDERHQAAQGAQRQPGDVTPAYGDLPLLRVGQPDQERQQSGFARPGGAGQAQPFARTDPEADLGQDRLAGTVGVADTDQRHGEAGPAARPGVPPPGGPGLHPGQRSGGPTGPMRSRNRAGHGLPYRLKLRRERWHGPACGRLEQRQAQ